MTQVESGTKIRKAEPVVDIYTVLALIAFMALAVGVVYVALENLAMTGEQFNAFKMLSCVNELLPFMA